MRRLGVTVLAAAALALVGVPDAGAVTCQDLLGGNAYDCSASNETGNNYTVCITMTTTGGGELNAVWDDPGAVNYTGTCSCDAKGTVADPTWDQAKTFLCGLDSTSGALAVSGRATSSGIANGRATHGPTGFSSRFKCTKRTSPCP